jgi:protocatechuate 4,5-dioxygenase beta chain
MARIIGCITTSHVPAIGNAIAKGRQEEPYWKEWFDGFTPVHRWLDRVRPDVAVVVYNDHGLNFFLDKLPTFAIGAGSGGGDVGVREVAATYHVPISNTAAGMMLLQPAG